MIRATEKQLRLIGRMEQYISARFTGNTIREASEFITNHMDEYQEEREMADESNVLYDDIFYEEGW
ncbi:hypothetical protein NSU09_11550 [Bacillus sp. PS194]|uniref:hypothetical protein n=1 Tax=Bacillales TaxID=1385 RepID=UPI000DEF3F74|nr:MULTISPECIES: hypothetical protein [Bacillales]MBW4823288.1 hypothetical protein [Bacillaceae bacterium]QMV49023.1 hypothetical protein Goe12_c00960 [Bacillus phage vB_BsuS-Goe12]QMV49201.1 hypothetical protein Goe13_c01000 [Bacillus phage vB_BsuS-Goe13]AXF33390.1 hypothetical protein DS740_11325 [Bacillus sp. DM2]MBG9786198.1 hypothetical protein [Brevibacillus laterosporus]